MVERLYRVVDEMKKNVVLVGFMGTGKSVVGRSLAATLGRPFIDMDELIESRAGKPIPRIFAEEGEPRFRGMERELTRELAGERGRVIAAGGGIVLDGRNIMEFSRSGLVVCLFASKEELLRRLAASTNRPLLANGSMEQKISGLLDERRHLYEAIPCSVDTSGLTIEEVADKILALLRENEGCAGAR